MRLFNFTRWRLERSRLKVDKTIGFAAILLLLGFFGPAHAQSIPPIDTCMEDVYEAAGAPGGSPLNCTAKEVYISEDEDGSPIVDVVILDDGCTAPGDTVTVDITASLHFNADRFDIGVYTAADGGNALTGACYADILPTTTPFNDLDESAITGDICGDVDVGGGGADIAGFQFQTLTLACTDSDSDGNLDLNTCFSWRVSGNNGLCTQSADVYPGTKSKCFCSTNNIPVPVPGQIVVVKQTIDNDGNVLDAVDTSFDFTLAGTPTDPSLEFVTTEFTLMGSEAGADDAYSSSATYAGLYSLTETLPDSGDWALDSASCDNGSELSIEDQGITGITVTAGDVVTCTIVNKLLFVAEPSIDIRKNDEGEDSQQVVSGDTVTFTIRVENTGNVALTNVVVNDPQLAACNSTIPTLGVGEVQTYTCTTAALTADLENVAEVSGTPPVGGPVTDSDPSTVDVTNPSVNISKNDEGEDSQQIVSGDTVTFTIRVENTGDVALTNVVVNDPQLAACNSTIPTLGVGEVQTYTCTTAALTADLENVAEVSGTPPVGGPVTDSDPSTVDVTNPGVKIDKTPTTRDISVGEIGTFDLTVTNTGDVSLSNVEVTDTVDGDLVVTDVSAPVGADGTVGQEVLWTIPVLDPGESLTVTVMYEVAPYASLPGGQLPRNGAYAEFVFTDNSIGDNGVLTVVSSVNDYAWVGPDGVTYNIHLSCSETLTMVGPYTLEEYTIFRFQKRKLFKTCGYFSPELASNIADVTGVPPVGPNVSWTSGEVFVDINEDSFGSGPGTGNGGGTEPPPPPPPTGIDVDGDGYSPPLDCNDNDATINPGALDRGGRNRDGIDNDCDGRVDR